MITYLYDFLVLHSTNITTHETLASDNYFLYKFISRFMELQTLQVNAL